MAALPRPMREPDAARPPAEPPPLVAFRHWLDAVSGLVALLAPLAVTLMRVSPSTQWRDDLAVVRALGLVPVGGEGTLTSVLVQLASMLPVGGRVLRASAVSALGLAISARLIYVLTRRVLEINATAPRLTPALSLVAALTATLAPSWQLEGTVAGGATIAAALALAGLIVRPSARNGDARVFIGFGAIVALAALESHATGAALIVALVVQAAVLGELPPAKHVAWGLLGAMAVALLCLLPVVIRPFAPHAFINLGFGLSTADVVRSDVGAQRSAALGAWFSEVGVIACGVAAAGAIWGVIRRKTRFLLAPLVAIVVGDAICPSRSSVLVSDALAPVRLLAVAALAIAASLAVHTVALGLQRARLPFARAAAALLVAFQLTLAIVTADDSSYLADRRAQHGAEVWTDEALGSLPYQSALLVRSESVAWHLWSASIVRGERPDVVMVPLPLLERGSLGRRLVSTEPALSPLVRELAINGRPNEYALSTLADARPLFLELDPSWDHRMFEHLVPHPMWLRFAPQPLGRSDRVATLKKGHRALRRVLAVAKQGTSDPATLAMLAERTAEQAAALAVLGDWESVAHVVEDLKLVDPSNRIALELEKRPVTQKTKLDVAELFQEEHYPR